MNTYSRQKRAKTDHCNICGKISELTWDHVPPKTCLNSIPVKFNHLMDGIPEFNNYKMSSQNGIRFRSLCSTCNNALLGKAYDPELAKLASSLTNHVRIIAEQGPPGELNLDALAIYTGSYKINRIARAICGHILAAKNEFDSQTIPDKLLREYFLNPTALPPQGLRLLVWFYPYSTIIIARDFVAKKVLTSSSFIPEGMCSILSSFPVAYLLCDDQYDGALCNLFDYCTANIDDDIPITFNFSSCLAENGRLRHPLWPAYIADNEDGVDFVLASKHTTASSVFGVRNLTL